ncbi:MAG: DegT/DnrJ/EryC1/StrS family aminotransferase [Puniceicoccales bacterium]|jgi:dTDP-4-amino-4,6-dideoxygalactose transaminase|nr:DegT/DnrJ/EryC1/StrS family aminotransferase [Puniceicoccales bacterium]
MAIFVTKSFLPKLSEYEKYIKEIWQRGVLTNQGPCVQELEQKMHEFLGVENFHYLTNGTIALQLALNALGITDGEIITTPFSYVATISSILWERCRPVFVDIEPNNFTIDADKIEARITSDTKAIMAVHVFGYPCDVEKIATIAAEHNLKVIYDGAHAFGAKYKGKSLLDHGDISTCSFHATKLFHTIEGGACIVKDKSVSDKLELARRFGHNYDDHRQLGINAKASEFHAAMGLANFPYISEIIASRKRASYTYDITLGDCVGRPTLVAEHEYNYAYYPVVFKNEEELKRVLSALAEHQIYPRRYFYPSLNTIKYVNGEKCPMSEDISSRIACLPLFVGLENKTIEEIAGIIRGGTE